MSVKLISDNYITRQLVWKYDFGKVVLFNPPQKRRRKIDLWYITDLKQIFQKNKKLLSLHTVTVTFF
jgi:hypothetical protein